MSYLQVVQDRNFVKLWLSQILSLIAQNLLNFALIIRIYDLTQGSRFANISVALLILSFGVPAVLLSSLAGVYVDHWDRKRVLVVSNFFRAVLVLGFLVFEQNLLVVMLLALLISSATQFFAPAEAASIPVVSKPSNLVKANGLFVTTFYATFIVGYSTSAPVIKAFGPQSSYLLAAAFFGVATILAVVLPSLGGKKSGNISFKQLWKVTQHDMKAGRKLIWNDPNLKYPIIQLMLVQAVVSVILTLAPALSLALLKQPLQDSSLYLVIPAGIGMLVGVLSVGHLTKHMAKTTLVKLGLLIGGVMITLLGLTGLLYRQMGGHPIAGIASVEKIVALELFLLGVTVSAISVTAQTLLHEMSEEKMRGTVFGVLYTLINFAATAPVLVAGVLADALSVTKVIALAGLLLVAYAVFQHTIFKPSTNLTLD